VTTGGARTWIEVASLGIELLAVAIIIVGIGYATVFFVLHLLHITATPDVQPYTRYKVRLSRTLLLGLEVLVAADVVRTVALEPTLQNVLVLGTLVLIRTFLSWSLVVELEGRWPWKPGGKTGPPRPANIERRLWHFQVSSEELQL
jgi:uncharacterized membrane protein